MSFTSNALSQESFTEKVFRIQANIIYNNLHLSHAHTTIIAVTGRNHDRMDDLRFTHSDRKRA